MAEIGRLITAMVTPFDENGEVDYAQAKRLANALLDSGSDGLVITGTTGEGPTLSSEEKIRLYGEVKQAIGNRGAVIAGTTDNDTAKSIELSAEAASVGADALLLTVPAYNKPPQEGLYQHFAAIAQEVDIPLILYNIPGRCAVNLEPRTIAKLAQIENIVGIKEASGQMDPVSEIVSR